MSQATFHISAADFNEAIFDKIKNFIKGQNAEVVIKVKTLETPEQAKARIDQSIYEIENKANLVTFSFEEFVEFSNNIIKKNNETSSF